MYSLLLLLGIVLVGRGTSEVVRLIILVSITSVTIIIELVLSNILLLEMQLVAVLQLWCVTILLLRILLLILERWIAALCGVMAGADNTGRADVGDTGDTGGGEVTFIIRNTPIVLTARIGLCLKARVIDTTKA